MVTNPKDTGVETRKDAGVEVKVAAEEFKLTHEMLAVLEKGREHSPLVRKALEHEERFRERTATELDVLLKGIKTLVDIKQDSGGADFDLKKLHEKVLAKIETNKALYAKATIELKKDSNVRFYARINKMESALEEAGKLLQKFENFEAFCEGRVPEEFEYHTKQKEYTYLGNQKGIWGNSKGTDLKAALTMTYLTFCYLDKVSDIELGTSIDKSAFRHQTRLPATFNALDGEDFRNFSFYKSGELMTLHSGYAWGGCQFDLTEFGPRDCSQFIQELSGCHAIITTEDLLYSDTAQREDIAQRVRVLTEDTAKRIRVLTKGVSGQKKSRGPAYDTWLAGTTYPETVKTFEPIPRPIDRLSKIFDKQSTVKTSPPTSFSSAPSLTIDYLDRGNGDFNYFYVVSRFNKEKDPKCEGVQTSGHSEVIVGLLPSEDRMQTAPRLLTFGCNRDREKKKIEGYGFNTRPYSDKPIPKADDPNTMEKTFVLGMRAKPKG